MGRYVDMDFYDLIDAYEKNDQNQDDQEYLDMHHNRQILGEVQKEVYESVRGKCRICGLNDNLHFDHMLPSSSLELLFPKCLKFL